MTYNDLIAALDSVIAREAMLQQIPYRTGRLRSALVVKRVRDGWEIYIDDGGISEEEWNDMFPFGAEIGDSPQGVAPYAESVNERTMFWRRVAFALKDKISAAVGADFNAEYRGDTDGRYTE